MSNTKLISRCLASRRTARTKYIGARLQGSGAQREPAKFRSTALDTHKASPAEDWGPSPDLLPQGFTVPPDYLTMLKTQRTNKTARSSLPHVGSTRGQVPLDQIEYASVFVPKPEQAHACSLARTQREKAAKSDWALLDTLEVELYNNEKVGCCSIASCIAYENSST